MKVDARHITIAVVIALMLMSVAFSFGWLAGKRKANGYDLKPVPDTTWFTITETKIIPSPPDTVMLTHTKVVKVPLHDTVTKTLVDSVWVSLPFEQHFANLDDVADVWYSGFQAKIDSAVVYKRTVTEIIRQPYEVKPPPNLVMVQAGITDASLTYLHRLGRSLWAGASAGSTYTGIPTARVSVGFQF